MAIATYENHFDRRKNPKKREYWQNRLTGYNGKQRKLGRPEIKSLGEYLRRIRSGEIRAQNLPVPIDAIPDFH